MRVHAPVLRRTVLTAAVAAAVAGCGSHSPTEPARTPVDVPLGAQVLRITALARDCVVPGDPASIIPFITRK